MEQIEVGTRLVIGIRGHLKMASVAHVHPEGKQWYLGCRFVGRLNDAEFAVLLGPEDDLRKEERQLLTLVTTCNDGTGQATFAAEIRNVSREGVGLLAAQPLSVGDTVALNLRSITKVALISFARRDDEQELWLLGCRFVGALTTEELATVMTSE